MIKQTHLIENIDALKGIRALITDEESLAVAAHCIDMAVLEISRIADTKVMKNERMMLEYLELSENDFTPGLWFDNANKDTTNLQIQEQQTALLPTTQY